jgi:hypothetical protein
MRAQRRGALSATCAAAGVHDDETPEDHRRDGAVANSCDFTETSKTVGAFSTSYSSSSNGLGVVPDEVVQPCGGCSFAEGAVWSSVVVSVEEARMNNLLRNYS